MRRVLVVGYGNPSRQDDGVGWYMVNRLSERYGLPTIDLLGEPADDGSDTAILPGPVSVRTLWVQQLELELAEDVAAVDRLFLLDAHVDAPDVVEVEVDTGFHVGVTTHVVTPETLLAVAQGIYGHRPEATRHSIRGRRWDFACELSPEVQVHADCLVERLDAAIRGSVGTLNDQ